MIKAIFIGRKVEKGATGLALYITSLLVFVVPRVKARLMNVGISVIS